jgi:hypothetical protein
MFVFVTLGKRGQLQEEVAILVVAAMRKKSSGMSKTATILGRLTVFLMIFVLIPRGIVLREKEKRERSIFSGRDSVN